MGGVEMTTTYAVAARLMAGASHRRRVKAAICTIVAGALLAGCGSSSLLGVGDTADTPTASNAPISAAPAAAPSPVSSSRVALAPIMGAPDSVSRDVGAQLNSALGRQRISVASSSDAADYTLRGYIVATKEKNSTKVSYIFDLMDQSGKRVNRIQGEELAAASGSDPWSAVTPDLAQKISDRAASSLAQALPTLSPSSAAAGAPVGVGAGSVARGSSAAGGDAAQTASLPNTPPAAGGAVNAAGLIAIVPAVSGAPGDGNSSLSNAMQQELKQSGIAAAAPGQKAYGVAGKVTVGPVKDGKQAIKIDWRVTDPNGAVLATVSQNNEIQAGMLDGAWGAIANDAAQGAVGKIKVLIEENRASIASGQPRQKAVARTKT